MVTIIRGGFKSGKTELILSHVEKEIKEKRQPLLLVPSRIQRDEFSGRIAKDISGYAGRAVFTFGDVLKQALPDERCPFHSISDFESFILIRLIIEENKTKLHYFKNIEMYSGVVRLIYSLIMELKAGMVLGDYEKIKNSAMKKTGREAEKWKDIYTIFEQYEERLMNKGLCDSYRLFMETAKEIKNNTIFSSCSMLAIDGFFDFTSVEFELIKALIGVFEKQNKKVFLTLPGPAYPLLEKTFEDFNKNFKIEVITLEEGGNPFAEISKSLLSGAIQNIPTEARISVIKAFGKYREIEKIAHEIKRLKIMENYSYNDVTMIIPNMEAYRSSIKSVFGRFQIPFYNTHDEPLKENPVIIYIFYICECVMRENAVDSVQILSIVNSNFMSNKNFKTLAGLTGVLSSYFRGNKESWEKAFDAKIKYYKEMRNNLFLYDDEGDYTPDELDRKINEAMEMKKIMGQFLSIIFLPSEKTSIDGFIEWLSGLISGFGIREVLNSEAAAGSLIAVKEFTAFRKLKDTLLSLKKSLRILGREDFSRLEFFQMFENLVQNVTYRFQYYPLEAVKIGAPFDIRESSSRAVFIAGLNEGEFPGGVSLSLLNGAEKKRVNETASRAIFQDEEKRSVSERLDFAVSISRCRERLYLSTTPYDESGREILPSLYLTAMLRLIEGQKNGTQEEDSFFEIVPSEQWMDLYDMNSLLSHDFDLLENNLQKKILLENTIYQDVRKMRSYYQIISAFNDIYEGVRTDDRETLKSLSTGRSYFGGLEFDEDSPSNRLNRDWAQSKLNKMIFSSSRLETFGNCRYLFLLKYLFGIREEAYPSQKIKSSFKGSFYHAVLKEYIEKTADFPRDYLINHRNEIRNVLDECVENNFNEFMNREGEQGLFSIEKEYYRRILRNFIDYDAQCLRDLKPVETEFAINAKLELEGGTALPVNGSIDRIDVKEGENGESFRIMDYKSGNVYHYKGDFLIPLKLFQGFIYAWSLGKPVEKISYVSIEKEGPFKKMDVLPYPCKIKAATDNNKSAGNTFEKIWAQKKTEIETVFDFIRDGNFLPFTLETDYQEEILGFYRRFYQEGSSIKTESDKKCGFCPYTKACLRRDKLNVEY